MKNWRAGSMNEQPIAEFPLQWPLGWKRTESYRRRSANFTRFENPLSIDDGVERVTRTRSHGKSRRKHRGFDERTGALRRSAGGPRRRRLLGGVERNAACVAD